jgi:tRNA pseudouridine55 synthase
MSVCGVLLLDKPEGLSSNAALQRVRRLLGADKAGHVGSLDPLASGMLPICLGEATKLAGEMLAGRKCYEFTLELGARTATGDREGEVVERTDVPQLTSAAITEALAGFHGAQPQIPPMYSALKREGRPLYQLARAGIEVERAPRQIQIDRLELLGREDTRLRLTLLCSKGTYVRVLAEDIARALGSCGHVIELRRCYVEPFGSTPMQTLEVLEQAHEQGGAVPLIAADQALPHMPSVRVPAAAALRLRQGQVLTLPVTGASGRVRLYQEGGGFLGLGELDTEGRLRPKRLFLVAGHTPE